ncbi:MAG: DUF3892 domain-containing protein [Candidatus Gracilibacteria bacterium]|nr:DUF3892 domain-containing protein [Candidatus Gracilibacteria bacterium]
MTKKTLKTIKEDNKGRNVESIDLKNLTEKQNKELIKKAEKGKLPGYHVVDPENGEKFLRSNPDRTSKNNLDPKLKIKKK